MLHSVGGNSCFKCAQSRTGNTLDFLTEPARVSFLNRNVMVCRQQNRPKRSKTQKWKPRTRARACDRASDIQFSCSEKGSCCSPPTQTLKYTFLNNKNKNKKNPTTLWVGVNTALTTQGIDETCTKCNHGIYIDLWPHTNETYLRVENVSKDCLSAKKCIVCMCMSVCQTFHVQLLWKEILRLFHSHSRDRARHAYVCVLVLCVIIHLTSDTASSWGCDTLHYSALSCSIWHHSARCSRLLDSSKPQLHLTHEYRQIQVDCCPALTEEGNKSGAGGGGGGEGRRVHRGPHKLSAHTAVKTPD